jgi:hypothetical protein
MLILQQYVLCLKHEYLALVTQHWQVGELVSLCKNTTLYTLTTYVVCCFQKTEKVLLLTSDVLQVAPLSRNCMEQLALGLLLLSGENTLKF